MGFADYLSRHPNLPPTGENMNENYVINIITALKYTLFTKQRKSANQKARQLSAQNDVKNHSNWSEKKQRAFFYFQANKQSLFITPLSKTKFQIYNSTQPKLYQFKQNINNSSKTKVHITTRRRPQLDTNTIPITRRHRAPNKKKMDSPTGNTSNNTNTIATQTEVINNTGQGRNPLISKQHFNPFAETKYEDFPIYLKNLHKVLGEEFIAEATRSDPQSRSLLQIIQDNTKTLQLILALSKTRLRSNTIRMHPIQWKVIHTDTATQTHYERNTQETSWTNRDDASRELNLVSTHTQGKCYAYSKLPTMYQDW